MVRSSLLTRKCKLLEPNNTVYWGQLLNRTVPCWTLTHCDSHNDLDFISVYCYRYIRLDALMYLLSSLRIKFHVQCTLPFDWWRKRVLEPQVCLLSKEQCELTKLFPHSAWGLSLINQVRRRIFVSSSNGWYVTSIFQKSCLITHVGSLSQFQCRGLTVRFHYFWVFTLIPWYIVV